MYLDNNDLGHLVEKVEYRSYDGRITLPMFAHINPGEKICFIRRTTNNNSFYIVPFEELDQIIASIKEPLNDKNITEEKRKEVERDLLNFKNAIIDVATVEGDGAIKSNILIHIVCDVTEIYCRNDNNRLVIYFGTYAFLDGSSTFTFKR